MAPTEPPTQEERIRGLYDTIRKMRSDLAEARQKRDLYKSSMDSAFEGWISQVTQISSEKAELVRSAVELRSANAALLKRAEDAERDTARLDWLERAHFTAYNHRDPENGRLYGACLVDEDQPTRRGIVKKTLRENIDAAKGDSA